MMTVLPGLFVNGAMSADTAGMASVPVVDPATGGEVGAILRGDSEAVDLAVQSAHARFRDPSWRKMPTADRGRLLSRLAAMIRSREDEIARIEALDVGKPLAQALGDIRTAARYFEYYGGMADKVLGGVVPVRWGALDFTLREPHGVCAQIVPWNFPLAMASRGIAPALAAGNCVVAKPAEDASQSLLKLAELAVEAGFPAGALNIVTGLGGEAGAALTAHPLVRHITFTGSVNTGKQVMRAAADRIVPVNLELGGKSPVVVFEDADLEVAAATVLRGFTVNAGQTCNACTRLLVHSRVQDALVDRIAGALRGMRLGHPLRAPDMGPLISQTQLRRVRAHLDAAREAGLTIREFGTLDDQADLQDGFFVHPTLVDGVGPDNAIFHDEVFGPCLSITTFDDETQAVQLANGTEYGLVAAIWTKDIARAMRLAHEIEAGQIYINGFGTGGSVEVPFGGMKSSGIGREKGIEGYINYTLTKSVTAHYA